MVQRDGTVVFFLLDRGMVCAFWGVKVEVWEHNGSPERGWGTLWPYIQRGGIVCQFGMFGRLGGLWLGKRFGGGGERGPGE
jgi:hypothetical protein